VRRKFDDFLKMCSCSEEREIIAAFHFKKSLRVVLDIDLGSQMALMISELFNCEGFVLVAF
jgi:hypothetical protein